MAVQGKDDNRIIYTPMEFPNGFMLDDSRSTRPYGEMLKKEKEKKDERQIHKPEAGSP